ncbi:MAG TPA: hypothetical protein VGM53_00555 [Streptosporangiaceae bacterium]|jgi:8-oxo-dGTP pyrophosphatase MutT (NUDIX family)
MIILIHLLQHLGVPSGIAIAVVIAVMKVAKGGGRKLGARRDRDGASRAGNTPYGGTFPAGKTPYGDEDHRDER